MDYNTVDFLFYDFFPLILGIADRVFDFLGKSFYDLVYDWIGLELPNWGFFNTPLIMIMLGTGLGLYISLTLAKWIIGIVT